MTTFRVVDSTTRHVASFLAVDEVAVAGDDGSTFVRTVVRHPGAVVVVPVAADGASALLVRQFRAATGDRLLEVPAGKRDVAGEPPEATAARELEEEIGYRPGRLVPLCEFFNTPGFCDEYTFLYCALDLAPVPGARGVTAEEEAMTVEPVRFDAVDGLIANRAIVDAKTIIGLLLTRAFVADGGLETP